jgi:hypothetical protein
VAGVVTGAGTAVIGVGVADTGAGAEGIGAGIAAAGVAVTGKPTKKPRASGAFRCSMSIRSDRAATSIGKNVAVRANATDGPHHDHRRSRNDDRSRVDNDDAATIGLASAIGTAMPAGAASACGIRGAEACERAGDQNCCCEKVLHVLSRF